MVRAFTGCSPRETSFHSQHPHGDSQLSVTPVSEDLTPDLMPLSASTGTAQMPCIEDTHADETFTHINRVMLGTFNGCGLLEAC